MNGVKSCCALCHRAALSPILLAALLSGCVKRHPLLDALHDRHEPVVIHIHCGCAEKAQTK